MLRPIFFKAWFSCPPETHIILYHKTLKCFNKSPCFPIEKQSLWFLQHHNIWINVGMSLCNQLVTADSMMHAPYNFPQRIYAPRHTSLKSVEDLHWSNLLCYHHLFVEIYRLRICSYYCLIYFENRICHSKHENFLSPRCINSPNTTRYSFLDPSSINRISSDS